MVHCRSRRTNFGYPKQSGHQGFREQGKTALVSCCKELPAYRHVCDKGSHEIWLLLLKGTFMYSCHCVLTDQFVCRTIVVCI